MQKGFFFIHPPPPRLHHFPLPASPPCASWSLLGFTLNSPPPATGWALCCCSVRLRWRSTPLLREKEQIYFFFSQTSLRAQRKVPDERLRLSSALLLLRRGRKSPSLQQQRTVKTSLRGGGKKAGVELAGGSLLAHRCRGEMVAFTAVLHVQPFLRLRAASIKHLKDGR